MRLPGSNFEAAWLTLETLQRRARRCARKPMFRLALRRKSCTKRPQSICQRSGGAGEFFIPLMRKMLDCGKPWSSGACGGLWAGGSV